MYMYTYSCICIHTYISIYIYIFSCTLVSRARTRLFMLFQAVLASSSSSSSPPCLLLLLLLCLSLSHSLPPFSTPSSCSSRRPSLPDKLYSCMNTINRAPSSPDLPQSSPTRFPGSINSGPSGLGNFSKTSIFLWFFEGCDSGCHL